MRRRGACRTHSGARGLSRRRLGASLQARRTVGLGSCLQPGHCVVTPSATTICLSHVVGCICIAGRAVQQGISADRADGLLLCHRSWRLKQRNSSLVGLCRQNSRATLRPSTHRAPWQHRHDPHLRSQGRSLRTRSAPCTPTAAFTAFPRAHLLGLLPLLHPCLRKLQHQHTAEALCLPPGMLRGVGTPSGTCCNGFAGPAAACLMMLHRRQQVPGRA